MQDMEANIAHLIHSVEPHFRPPKIDREALAQAIRLCLDWFADARKYSTGKHETERRRLYQEALPIARKLASLLNNEILWDDRHRTPQAKTSRELVQELLLRLQQEVGSTFASYDDLYIESFKDWTPFERLFGDHLPTIFSAAGFSGGETIQARSAKGGPYVSFAVTFANLFEIERSKGRRYSVASFIKATKRPLSTDARERRKLGPHRLASPGFFESWHISRSEQLRRLFETPPTRGQSG